MGILERTARFVVDLKLPRGFSVCELGDQFLTYTTPHRLAVEWYAELGAGRYVSIDGNGRNGALVWDLNEPLSGDVLEQINPPFDVVTDFGTGEHVFDQAQVWRTIHYLTKRGGFIVFDRPHHGYPDHCFYNLHATLVHDLAAANAYDLIRFEAASTKRGALLRGVFRKTRDGIFENPQQGRYEKILQLRKDREP